MRVDRASADQVRQQTIRTSFWDEQELLERKQRFKSVLGDNSCSRSTERMPEVDGDSRPEWNLAHQGGMGETSIKSGPQSGL